MGLFYTAPEPTRGNNNKRKSDRDNSCGSSWRGPKQQNELVESLFLGGNVKWISLKVFHRLLTNRAFSPDLLQEQQEMAERREQLSGKFV